MIYINIDDIIEKYNSGISASELARQNNVSVWTILNRLRKYNVPIRTFIEQNEKKLNLNKDNKEKFIEIVDGLMLGDGNIHNKKKYIQISQNGKNVAWLFQLKEIFANIGAECTLTDYGERVRKIGNRNIIGKPGKVLFTPAYVELRKQRARWFPNGEKQIPSDVRITPLSMALWLCGDGTNDGKGGITFYTNSFSQHEVQFLLDKINKSFDIKGTISERKRKGKQKSEYVLSLRKRNETYKLKNIVEDFIPECFKYKLFNLRKSKRGRPRGKLSPEQITQIRYLQKQGKSYSQIAKQFDRSISAIYNIINRHTYKYIL